MIWRLLRQQENWSAACFIALAAAFTIAVSERVVPSIGADAEFLSWFTFGAIGAIAITQAQRGIYSYYTALPVPRSGILLAQGALMLALCHRPDLLLLDEPGGGLDPAARREFLEASVQLLNREGAAILFSSHHMNDVERIGERVVFLDEGVVRLDRGIDSLREDFCIAMVSKRAAPDVSAVARTPGCLRTRSVGEDWHALFEGPPEEVARRLGNSLGADDVRCVRAPLEELFIELVGGER